MPSVNDIVAVAEALEKSPIAVIRDRCVAVRNRNATCRACVDACPTGAIAVRANEVTLDVHACVNCGACAPSCPTEALVTLQPSAQAVLDAAVSSMGDSGRTVIACARIAAKRQADPSRFAEVPCLSYVDETLLVELAARKADTVLLVDGNCATCKFHNCLPALNEAVGQAQGLLAVHGSDTGIERVTGFPDDLRENAQAGEQGSTRRGFFSEAVGAARKTAMTAAKTTLENELGYRVGEPSIGERLRVTEAGTLPQLRMGRHEAALNALDVIGQPGGGVIESRLFASVSIDRSACNACGMCAVFCPTGALRRNPPDAPSDPVEYLEFSAADCVGCGLCADVCWKDALTLTKAVDVAELYDFEPRLFKVSASRKTR